MQNWRKSDRCRIRRRRDNEKSVGQYGGFAQTGAGHAIVKIVIDPEVVKSGDADIVQDLMLAATNDALRKAREMMANEMKSLTGGLNLPGLF